MISLGHMIRISSCSIFLLILTRSLFTTGQALTPDGQLPLRSDGHEPLCRVTCSHDKHRPLCGTDGRTYVNRCELQKAVCDGHNVRVHKRGQCAESTRCLAERKYAQKQARRKTQAVYIPECHEDGSYSEVQCHSTTGYCWCATSVGRPIPGSSVRWGRPDCKTLRNGKPPSKRRASLEDQRGNRRWRIQASQGRSESIGCGESEQRLFNQNLVKLFVAEFSMVTTSPQSVQLTSTLSREENVIRWKFASLDVNQDQQLDRRELKLFKRMVKKFVAPRSCGRMFTRHCDLSQDAHISLRDWTTCLAVSIDKSPTASGEPRNNTDQGVLPLWNDPLLSSSPEGGTTVNPDEDVPDCAKERQIALDQQQVAQTEIYIPECTTEGPYSRVQCFRSTGYCWCVNVTSGRPIPGTSVKNQKPECDSRSKVLKGCPENIKIQFLNELIDVIDQIIRSANHSAPESIIERSDTIKWQFTHIDKNNNKLLDRKEWKQLKTAFRAKKSTRSCSRHFFRYCDVNNDKKVSSDEWSDCVGNSAGFRVSTSAPTRRFGKNPLDKYLKTN